MVVLGTSASCGTKEALFFEYFWHSLFSYTMGDTHVWEMWDSGFHVHMYVCMALPLR